MCSAGKCSAEALPEGADCDTQSGCALEGKCQANKCVVTKAKDCDDGNVCTADDCDVATGICAYTAQFDNVACSDGNGCTVEARCFKGTCIAKKQKECDDNNVCSKDACDPKTGKCVVLPGPATDTCDDDNPCTLGDSCDKDSNCVPGKPVCGCQTNADRLAKDDGNLCNGQLYCDQATKQCKLNAASVVKCDPAADGACAVAKCFPETGQCVPSPVKSGTPCTDGNPCTVGDGCDGLGKCTGGTKICACTKNADCLAQNDGDVCNGSLFCNTEAKPATCEVNPATVDGAVRRRQRVQRGELRQEGGLCRQAGQRRPGVR